MMLDRWEEKCSKPFADDVERKFLLHSAPPYRAKTVRKGAIVQQSQQAGLERADIFPTDHNASVGLQSRQDIGYAWYV